MIFNSFYNNIIHISSFMKYQLASKQLKIPQRLFIQKSIMMDSFKLNMMILVWKQNLF